MRGALLLLGLCLGLGGVIAYQQTQAPAPVGQAPGGPAAAKTDRAPLPEIKDVPEAAYAHVVDANLFDPDRRPTLETAPSSGPKQERAVPGAPPFELKGVITTPQGRMALIRLRRERKYRQVVKGAEVEGWVVESIATDRISVKNADAATELELKTPEPAIRRLNPRPRANPRRPRRQE